MLPTHSSALPDKHRSQPAEQDHRQLEALSAIAEFTAVNGSEQLRQHFVQKIARYFPVSGIRFLCPENDEHLNAVLSCEIHRAGQQTRLEWNHDPKRNIPAAGALGRCLREKRHVYPQGSHNFDYFPVLNSQQQVIEIVEIRQQVRARAERVLFGELMKIYANFARVLQQKDMDSLTGLLNRAAFDQQLHISSQALRDNRRKLPGDQQWWLMLLRVDQMGEINDSEGMAAGDDVLIQLADMLRSSFRGVDRLYRYSNEEFAVLLSPCSRNNTMRLGQRLLQNIRETRFPRATQVSVSIGLTAIDRCDYTVNLLGHAQQALFEARRRGGDQIQAFDHRSHHPLRPGLHALSA